MTILDYFYSYCVVGIVVQLLVFYFHPNLEYERKTYPTALVLFCTVITSPIWLPHAILAITEGSTEEDDDDQT